MNKPLITLGELLGLDETFLIEECEAILDAFEQKNQDNPIITVVE